MQVVCFSPYPAEGPSVRHRIVAYEPFWKAAGIDLTLWPFMSPRFYRIRRRFGPLATLRKLTAFAIASIVLVVRLLRSGRFDVVIVHRELYPIAFFPVLRLLKAINPRIVFDFDDALWASPTRTVDQRRWLRRSDPVAELSQAARHVVAGSPVLRDYALQHSSHVDMIPTSYDDLGGGRSRDTQTTPVVVWIGNLGNARYLEDILPALRAVHKKAPFVLRIVGGADIESLSLDGLDVELCLWSPESEGTLLTSADIGIMPLWDEPYERGKCAFKIIQYFSAGLPAVASPVGMNQDIIKDGENGILADTIEEWRQALKRLLLDRSLRATMGACGYRTYLDSYTREVNAKHWETVLKSVSR